MRLGLLVTSVGSFGNKGFYNLQEVGLARELDKAFEEVLVYRLVSKNDTELVERIEGCANATLRLIPARKLGSNGKPDFRLLDPTIDLMVYFSDTQLFFSSVYQWCRKNNIRLIPYIGVSRSHSDNPVKQFVRNILFFRNLKGYRKLPCLAKTPAVCHSLIGNGVKNITVAPVGLDTERLDNHHGSFLVSELRKKYGFAQDDKIILFIGRMTAEKQPCLMIRIFNEVIRLNQSYRLCMVGSGELSDAVYELVEEYGLTKKVKRLEKIPNDDIWELYRIADCFVNLNRHEIYGMVLLEAMFYGCKVIAWNAPGPDFIIRDGVTGYLTDSLEKTVRLILDSKPVAEQSRAAILSDFTWKKTAGIITELAGEEKRL